MERGERVGLGIATVAHLALLAALSLGVATRPPPPIKLAPPIDVQLVDAIGAQSAAPVIAQDAPAPSAAPDVGPPEEAAPADAVPAPTPAPPKPAPAPPEPAPAPPKPEPAPPKPTPPKPTPKPEPKPTPAPPKPAPKPVPAPKPRPAPKPVPAKPAPAPAKPTPAKPALARPATPAKAAPVRAAPATPAKAAPAKAAQGRPGATSTAKAGAGKAAQTRGGIASDDFLKGITPEKSPGKAQAPRAQAISALAMNGLAAAIKRQIQPCYELGSLGGTPAMSIVTVLNLRFNKDGTVAGTPTLVDQSGVTDANGSYAKQIADVGRRAVLRCAPLKLPPELYAGGWENLNFRFTPGQMQ